MTVQEKIGQGKTFLGIELGSTRIKACLIDDTFSPIAGGSHSWENRGGGRRVGNGSPCGIRGLRKRKNPCGIS